MRRVRALISAKAKVKRVERSMDLQEWLKENPNTVIIFSDKKIFTGTYLKSGVSAERGNGATMKIDAD